jgi:hypothetical protein
MFPVFIVSQFKLVCPIITFQVKIVLYLTGVLSDENVARKNKQFYGSIKSNLNAAFRPRGPLGLLSEN